MTPTPEIIEAAARAICRADGLDPDSEIVPTHANPAMQTPYPAWHDYIAHARVVLPMIEREAVERCADEIVRLRAVLRVNMLRWFPEKTHAEIDAEIASVTECASAGGGTI